MHVGVDRRRLLFQIPSHNYSLMVSSFGDTESIVEVESHSKEAVDNSLNVPVTVSTIRSESLSESSLTTKLSSPSVPVEQKESDTTDLNSVNSKSFPPYPSDAKPLLVFATTVMDSNVEESCLCHL